MASTYENDLRLEEMATGENSGSWGTKTNTNLELIADAFSYGTETIANADTTITIADGAADAARSLALKINSSEDLTTTRVVTLAPNTTSKVWIIENNTSGGQVLTISAGSGSNVTLANGTTKIIATDGIGAGSNVVELTQDLAIADMSVDGILSLADGSNSAPSLTNTGDTNTGLYFPAADEVGITTGGTQRVKVDSTGIDVTGGLAVDTDTLYVDAVNDRVYVNATSASATANREFNVLGAGNTYIRVETDGTDWPAIELANVAAGKETWTIRNDDTANDFFVTGDDGKGIRLTNDNKFGIGNIDSNDPSHPLYVDYTSTETTAIVPMARLIARSSGTTGAGFGNKIDFLAQRETGNALQAQGSLEYVASTNSGTTLSSDLVISTAKAGVSTEALRVNSEGAVIIGTGDSIASVYSLYINNSAPILAFTDSNSFTDANDRWEIRGSSNGGFNTLETQFYDDSASTTTVYARYRTDRMQFNPDAADIDFVVKGDTNSNLFHVDASTDNIGMGLSNPDYRLHVMSNTNNSDIARFTGGQKDNGLLISTYSSGGSNDGGVDFTAIDSFGFRANGTDVLNLYDTSVSVPDGLQARFSSTQGYSLSGGGSKASFRIGRLTGLGTRARIELTGSNGYGDGAFGTVVCEAGQGNAADEMMLNIYNIGQNAVSLKNDGLGSYDFYTDRIDSTTFDIYVLLGTYYRVNFQVIEQTGFTPYFDNLNTSGGAIPGTATQANNRNLLSLQAETISFYDNDSTVRKATFTSGNNLVVGNNGTGLNSHRLQVISPDAEPAATFYRQRSTSGGTLMGFMSDVGGSQTTVARVYSEGSALFNGGVYIGTATNANHLDTYEYGSFTVTISDGTATENWDTAYYVKVGQSITITGRLTNVPNVSSFSGSQSIRIGNIPYPSIGGFNGQPLSWRDPADTSMYHVRSFELNSTQMFLKNDANTNMLFSDVTTSSDLFFSMTYVTSS